jgi:tetratricopeptide (TPR) repeat protein
MNAPKPRPTLAICALLCGLTVVTFWQVLHADFVNFDDNSYVTQNLYVLGGLKAGNIAWAFKTAYFGNWHPLTWLSHMLDVELFGLKPGLHHLTNLLLHICNTCLLFWFLSQATQRTWPGALVAALFAVHPLHVESVAWISERKDLLSTFFALLSLLSYLGYVRNRSEIRNPKPEAKAKFHFTSRIWLISSLIFFALGLMSKAMIVTLPFLMLLLDYWPLKRLSNAEQSRLATEQFKVQGSRFKVQGFISLVHEKLPFFALTFFFTFISSQALAASSTNYASPSKINLIANAFVSYVRYLGKAFWPVNLSAFYPRLSTLPAFQVAASVAAVVLLSIIAVSLARRRPYVFVGWFWFLGTLVPVIALPFGDHSIADRYTYVPLIGLFIAIVWTLSEPWTAAVSATSRSIARPDDSRDQKSGAAVASPSPPLEEKAGERRLSHQQLAPFSVSFTPRNVIVITLALLLIAACAGVSRHQLNYWRTSKDLLEHALAVSGDSAMAHNNLAALHMVERNWPDAEKHLTDALRLQPTFPAPRINLARVLAQEGKSAQAVQEIEKLNPTFQPEGHRQLAETFLMMMNTNAALEQYSSAVQLAPTNAAVRETLGLLLANQGKIPEATEQFNALVQLRPDAQSHYRLALSLLIQGKAEESITHYEEAIRLKPDWPEPLNDLAWLFATYPRAELRNGPQAVELAERACKLTNFKEARFLGTLDAAYAESGRFPEAITTAEEAKNLAVAAGDKTIADLADERLKLYRSGLAYHQL